MDVYRQKPIPVIYSRLPFIRAVDPWYFADSPEYINSLLPVALGKQCMSILEDTYDIKIRYEFSDDILQRRGDTNELLILRYFYWRLSDVERLFDDGRPHEAVSLDEAGIDLDFVWSIASKSSCIPLLEKMATALDHGRYKGYRLEDEMRRNILAAEKQLIAKLEIEELKGIRRAKKQSNSQSTSARPIPPKVHTLILRRDKHRCVFCRRGPKDTKIEVDHIMPRSIILKLNLDEGLFEAEENLCTTCFHCNRGKRDHLAKEHIDFYINAFSDPRHPNYGIVKYLEAVSRIQDMVISS